MRIYHLFVVGSVWNCVVFFCSNLHATMPVTYATGPGEPVRRDDTGYGHPRDETSSGIGVGETALDVAMKYLGAPTIDMQRASDMTDMAYQHRTLPAFYKNKNFQISKTITLYSLDPDKSQIMNLFPLTLHDQIQYSYQFSKPIPSGLDLVPEEGVASYIEWVSESGSVTMQRYGKALKMEHGFLWTKAGQDKFKYTMDVFADLVVSEHASHIVAGLLRENTMLSCFAKTEFASLGAAQKLRNVLKLEEEMFGGLGKNYGEDLVVGNVQKIGDRRHIDYDSCIVPKGATHLLRCKQTYRPLGHETMYAQEMDLQTLIGGKGIPVFSSRRIQEVAEYGGILNNIDLETTNNQLISEVGVGSCHFMYISGPMGPSPDIVVLDHKQGSTEQHLRYLDGLQRTGIFEVYDDKNDPRYGEIIDDGRLTDFGTDFFEGTSFLDNLRRYPMHIASKWLKYYKGEKKVITAGRAKKRGRNGAGMAATGRRATANWWGGKSAKFDDWAHYDTPLTNPENSFELEFVSLSTWFGRSRKPGNIACQQGKTDVWSDLIAKLGLAANTVFPKSVAYDPNLFVNGDKGKALYESGKRLEVIASLIFMFLHTHTFKDTSDPKEINTEIANLVTGTIASWTSGGSPPKPNPKPNPNPNPKPESESESESEPESGIKHGTTSLSSTNEPEEAITQLLKLPINFTNIKAWFHNGYNPPVGHLQINRDYQFRMGTSIFVKRGRDTAMAIKNHGLVEISDDTHDQTLQLDLRLRLGFFVYNHKNVVIARNTSFHGLVHGGGTEWYKTFNDYQPGFNESDNDMYLIDDPSEANCCDLVPILLALDDPCTGTRAPTGIYGDAFTKYRVLNHSNVSSTQKTYANNYWRELAEKNGVPVYNFRGTRNNISGLDGTVAESTEAREHFAYLYNSVYNQGWTKVNTVSGEYGDMRLIKGKGHLGKTECEDSLPIWNGIVALTQEA